MSQATKKKYVTKEVLDEFCVPEGDQRIVKVLGGKGNNLHQVFDPQSTDCNDGIYLVSMPTKFRKSVWIKRGDFVIVEPIEEGDKVKAEIVRILYKEQIKYIKSFEGLWPQFPGQEDAKKDSKEDQLFVNTNRPNLDFPSSSSESESDED